MPQGEGEGTVESGEESETPFEILVCGESDDPSEQGNDNSDERHQNDGHHQSLNKQDPVALIGGTRISQEGDAGDERGEDRDANRPSGDASTSCEIGAGVFLPMCEIHAHAYSQEHGHSDDDVIKRMHF